MVLRLFSRSSSNKDQKPGKDQTNDKAAATARTLASDASPEEIASAAKSATSAKERLALVGRINDAKMLRNLSEHSNCLAAAADRLAEIESLDAALALTQGTQARQIELAIATHNNELRTAQINAMVREESLVALEHASRSKNKACNRLTRARLDSLRRARTAAEESAALAQDIATQAKRLDQDAHTQARFAALAEKYSEAKARHTESQKILALFDEHLAELVEMPPPPEASTANITETGPDFKALSQAFAELHERLVAGTNAKSCVDAMNNASAAWRDAIKEATPQASEIDVVAKSSALFESIRKCELLLEERSDEIAKLLAEPLPLKATDVAQLKREELAGAWLAQGEASAQRKSIAKQLEGINYPASVPEPAVLEELSARKTSLTELIKACSARQAELETSFAEQVKKLAQALEAGELKRAEAARGEARSLQDALPGGAAKDTRKRYGSLIGNMQNLRDWQHFATDPKREELCTKMQAIADAPKEPDEQAELVKELRSQWNALGGKGPKDIAARFDEAAARAFEPCRVHYAKLAEARATNLELRKQILEQLEQFVADTDWANADLSAARTILNSARTAWRDAFPVERGANKPLEKRFQTTTDTLYSNLQDGWSGNLAAKEKLVARAEELLASEDPLPARLDAAKKLQQQWKQTGPVPRGPDQKLWKRFRAASDTLFNTRDEERSAQQAEYARNQEAANARLNDFEQAIATTATTDLDRAMLSDVKRDLDSIENLDRSVIKRARELEDKFKLKMGEKAAAEKSQHLDQLKALDTLAAANEVDGQSVSAEVTEQDARFKTRKEAAENAHLDLVLEAEAQAGIDSLPGDAQRRMELQVLKLNAGMNSGARARIKPMEMAEQWCALKATSDSVALRDRFFAAVRTLLSK